MSMDDTAYMRYDFTHVVKALADYSAAGTGTAIQVSGWDVQDRNVYPPAALLEHLRAVERRPRDYACPRDFQRAKAAAADLFRGRIRMSSGPVESGHCTFTQNSTQALLQVIAALASSGVEQVVIAAPCYYAAVEIPRRLGLRCVVIPAREYLTGALDIERLAVAAAHKHSVVLVTNPAYSLGVEYPWRDLRALFTRLGERTPVLLDETRLGLHWRDEHPWYVADYPPQVIVLRSPSKLFFTNGMKLSLLLGDPCVIRAVEQAGEALVGSLAGNAEDVALAYLAAWRAWSDECATERRGPMRAWRTQVVERLRANRGQVEGILRGHGYTLSPADSGPYMLAATTQEVAGLPDCAEVARQDGVLLMEPRYFLHEMPGHTGFRVNLAANGVSLHEALARILSSRRDGGPASRVAVCACDGRAVATGATDAGTSDAVNHRHRIALEPDSMQGFEGDQCLCQR